MPDPTVAGVGTPDEPIRQFEGGPQRVDYGTGTE